MNYYLSLFFIIDLVRVQFANVICGINPSLSNYDQEKEI